MQTFLTSQSNDERILEIAKALDAIGLSEFSKQYFNEGGSDFFKITKGEENIVHAIYLDIDDEEYSVHGFYGHEHVATAEQAVSFIEGLYNEEIVECAFALPFCTATAFVVNDRPQKEIVDKMIETVTKLLSDNKSLFMSGGGHWHIFSEYTLSTVKIQIEQTNMPQNAKLYVRVGVMGTESDDIYIFN